MLSIGDRVKVGVDRGVVCYTGAVEGYSGDWVGIDWDDPLRGKHDGTLDGKVYFCARSAKSGSFVRPQAVSVGRNLLEEIEDKYVNNGPSDKIYGRINLHHTNLNVYKKQSNPWALKTIIVDGMRVASAPCKNCSPFTNCTELNLHNNLLSRWCDLLDILSFFPSLRCLLASCNHMERRMESVADDRVVTAPLHTLAFGECCVDDETAKKIMYHFPYVRIIYLDHNNIQTFDPGEFGQNLESIDLEGNPINDFSNLQFLSTLPKLQSLNVAHCGFRDIRIPDNGFSSLSSLNISNNPMDNKLWVLELAKLPSLEKLNYTKNSIVDSGNDLNEIIISAIPQLRFLCHSEVTLQERSSAEIYFLNKYGVPPVAHEYKFIIERLVKIYGEPLNHPCASYGKIGLLKLKLSCGGQVMERLFPDTMTVQRLIGIISRLFRLDSRNISLQSQDHSGSIMDLDKPLRSLSFYSLSDGDTICAIPCYLLTGLDPAERIKLEAKNSTICTAAILTYRVLRKSAAARLCPYTIASACLLLAAKVEEDDLVKTRDVVNVAYSILHPLAQTLQLDEESWALRTSFSRMEYIVLRLLKFRLTVDNPHKYLLHYISSLMHWCPHEFVNYHIGTISFIVLRDAHADPDWILSHSPQTIAIVCLGVALRLTKVSIGVRWYSVFYSSMTKSKLRRLEEELIELIAKEQE